MPRHLIAIFEHEDDVVSATRQCREAGFRIADVYAPYAVHGLDEAMGLKRSRLTWVAFGAGFAGFTAMLTLEGWTSAVDWPLIIGGKEPMALPAFIPVAFEAMVLVAGLTVMLALFWRSKLRPGKVAKIPHPRVTNDRFALVLSEFNAVFDNDKADAILKAHHVESIEWVNENEGEVLL